MSDLIGKVDEHILIQTSGLSSNAIELREMNLTYNRLDLAFKLLYLESIETTTYPNYKKSIYKEHISAFTQGTYTERGNPVKDSYDKYEKIFIQLYKDIKNDSFDSNRSIVPLAKDDTILNGAHRTSAALFLNKKMHVIKTDLPPFMFDYKYFLKREVAKKTLDLAVQTFMKYDNNCFLALIWPAAQGHDEEVEKILSKVVYNKKVNLNANGAHNLLAQAYCDETWLGLSTQNYPGILKKLNNCFPIFEPVRVYIFQADSLSKVFTLKDKVRELFNIGKHAIHIADTKEESVRLARLLLNDNAIHFLNYGYPNKFDDFTFKMNAFRGFLKDNQLEPDCYAIDSGMVMAAYGLRKANDIDYLASSTIFETAMIEHHGSEVKYHNIAESEIVDNPKYHFWYDGIKFISIRQLFQMKNNRNEKKDQLDVKLIKPILRNQILFARLKKFKLLLISLIKKIGIYKQVKYLYKKSQNQTK